MDYSEDIKDLVIARLQTLPDGKDISVGSAGDFTKEQLIESVERRDELGKKMVDIEMAFLRGLKEGNLYELIGNEA